MKKLLMTIALLVMAPALLFGAQTSSPSIIRVGHWMEVRGELTGEGVFEASQMELMEPQRYEVLIGTVTAKERDELVLLGQPVQLSEKTEWEGVRPSDAVGARVKLEGYYRRQSSFAAREISARGDGRERLGGRVDAVRRTDRGLELEIMRYRVLVPEGLEVEHERPWQELPLAPAEPDLRAGGSRDEDDLFGAGYRLGDVLFSGQIEVRSTAEENFDLDEEDEEDRVDDEGSARLRLDWTSGGLVTARVEGQFGYRYRDDEEDGVTSDDSTRLGEAFVYLSDPFSTGLDLQIGRQDFDESREWLYDQNLDGVRLFGRWQPVALELSVTTSLSDADERDLESTNYIAYLSNGAERRHIAAYAIHRDFDLAVAERTTHVGLRLLGDWIPQNRSWLEVARAEGTLGGASLEGWGGDVGTTWTPSFARSTSFTLGYAYGSGDRSSSTGGSTFRQTGLHDNNGKFDGVTSFRYYGELFDPELANLHIFTGGVGRYLAPRTSLDLVGHYYRQVVAHTRLVDAEVDSRLDGVRRDLGWELDAILGWRGRPDLDLEVVVAYFVPGAAFRDQDNALLGKIQLRYRI